MQLGFDDVKPSRSKFPAIGHARKAGTTPKRFVREIRLTKATDVKQGDVVTVEEFEKRGIGYVDVVGTTRGFGFQGVMKRHHFGGQPGSHGTERKHRSPGGIGGMAGDRGRGRSVKKGKKMAGHMGDARRTARNQRLIQVDKDKNILVIEGAIPRAARRVRCRSRKQDEEVEAREEVACSDDRSTSSRHDGQAGGIGEGRS